MESCLLFSGTNARCEIYEGRFVEARNDNSPGHIRSKTLALREYYSQVPLLAWLTGGLAAVLLERLLGTPLAHLLGLPKVPVLFGFVVILKKPLLIPGTFAYLLLVYVLPVGIVARLSGAVLNRLATWLEEKEPDWPQNWIY